MNNADYWLECVSEACGEAGIEATDEQLQAVATDVQIAHDNYGMAFYQPAETGANDEINRLRLELKRERDKVVCPQCGGRGIETGPVGASHYYRSQCDRCNGAGKVDP